MDYLIDRDSDIFFCELVKSEVANPPYRVPPLRLRDVLPILAGLLFVAIGVATVVFAIIGIVAVIGA